MSHQILDDLNLEKRSSSKFKFKFKFKWNAATKHLSFWLCYIVVSAIGVYCCTYSISKPIESVVFDIFCALYLISYAAIVAIIITKSEDKLFAILNIGTQIYSAILMLISIFISRALFLKLTIKVGWHPQLICFLIWVLPIIILSELMYFLAKEFGMMK